MILDFKFDTTNNNNNPGNNDGIYDDNENCLTFTCKDGNCVNPQIDIDPNNNNNNNNGDDDDDDNSASSPFIDSLKCKDKGDSTEDNPNPCADVSMQCLLEHDGILDGSMDYNCGSEAKSMPEYFGEYNNRFRAVCDDQCQIDTNTKICNRAFMSNIKALLLEEGYDESLFINTFVDGSSAYTSIGEFTLADYNFEWLIDSNTCMEYGFKNNYDEIIVLSVAEVECYDDNNFCYNLIDVLSSKPCRQKFNNLNDVDPKNLC